MGATMHADTPEQVLAMLEGPPLFINRELLANIHAVVTLRLDRGPVEMTRRLVEIAIQAPDRSPPLTTLVSRGRQTDALTHNADAGARAALAELLRMRASDVGSDLEHRVSTLQSWLDGGLLGAAEFLTLLERYHSA